MTHRSEGIQSRLMRGGSGVAAIVVVIGLGLAPMPSAAVWAQSPSPAASHDGRIAIIATGPFGSVAGLPLSADAALPDPSTLEALDAYGRGARVTISPAAGAIDHWRVTVTGEPSLDAAHTEELGAGESDASAVLRLPSSGLFLVRLDGMVVDPGVPDDPGSAGSWVWRIAVPDRDVPGGGDPYPPMPAIILASAGDNVDLDPGTGCFIGTCGDIGATSPPRTLPTIRTIAGAPLSVRLADGSGIAAWTADATPIGATDDGTIALGGGEAEPAAHSVMFGAPPRGRWVILVHVRFDRDRGSSDGYARLILGP
jgi:hypothetical protein